MKLAETVGKILECERCVLKVDAAGEVRITQGAVRFNSESCSAACGQVGIDRLSKLKVDGAVGCHVQASFFRQVDGALNADVSLLAGNMQRIKADLGFRHRR